ncbi:MAG: hypothetical protein LBD78_04915 [Spirochaetaceae bacterium]|jgi:hypothetical protein|nr:hypothetical protein [Spirochaetaceae bacterium]
MSDRRFRSFFPEGLFLCILAVLMVSCVYKKPAGIPFSGAGEETVLLALSKAGLTGSLGPSGPSQLRYSFEKPPVIPPDTSLELDYVPAAGARSDELVLEIGGTVWTLPRDAAFLGVDSIPGRIRYAVPVPPGIVEGFSITRISGSPPPADAGDAVAPVFRLRALRFIPRWFGFAWEPGPPIPPAAGPAAEPAALPAEGPTGAPTLSVSPFVFLERDVPEGGDCLVIEPFPEYRIAEKMELSLLGLTERALVTVGDLSFDFASPRSESEGDILIPQGIFPAEPYPVRIRTESSLAALDLGLSSSRVFPAEPVPADPGIILAYPQSAWRDPRYEIFRWPRFPALIIFDTADYQFQDRLFKRLAFFTEKRDFRGRLVSDEEMAELHGWNAHDYRAEDLARFFETARQQGFPLNPEERELENILLDTDIIRRAGEFTPGEGGVISISRESPDYLRNLFMIHEGFHGLFFIDAGFRDFSRRRWENLDSGARRFIRSYFDSQRYDLADSYLIINEFMAYCLQQPVSEAGKYFGETLAGRIHANLWRRSVLPPGDEESASWPSLAWAFSREAEAFSAYVNARWGLAAGRIRSVVVRRLR